MTKVCRGCGIEKPLDDFHKHPLGKHGKEARCKECKHLAYLVDAERRKARARERYAADAALRERRRLQRAAWNDANRERIKATTKSWLAVNRERHAASVAAWDEAHREQRNEYARARRKRDPDRVRAAGRRGALVRRAREAGAAIGERVDADTCYQMHGGRCGICGKFIDLSLGDGFHVDHVIPLSKGGDHSYANTQPSHPSCNRRKHDRLDYKLERSTL